MPSTTSGLIDYFSDEVVVRLLDYIHAKLVPGGLALLGNFRPGHANEAFFMHALDWPLTLRSEAELAALVQSSRFRDGRSAPKMRMFSSSSNA